ncbi:MAG: Gn_AT_II protein [Podoviridae sp. ctbj_2]|nr:MAG: Gn_AT_II protein [Podoviridae sp. ctbj_2]
MFGKLDINLERMFKDMLIMDQVRGPHSTGVVSVNRNTLKSQYQKKLGTPDELMNDKRFSDLFMGQLGCLIGHNRYATKGAINRQNAHPFDMDGLIGVHNGTLNSYTRLEDHNKFDVDSQALYNHIDSYGLKDALSKVIGAYALVWWDKKESTVNIIRNADRPLYIAETDDGTALIISSEPGILIACGWRNNIKFKDPQLMSADHHAAWKIGSQGLEGKGVVAKVESPKFFPVANTKFDAKRVNATVTGGTTSSVALGGTNAITPKTSMFGVIDTATLNLRNVLFEVMDEKSTSDGSKYWLLDCPTYPEKVFRLHHHNNLPNGINTGEMIRGDVSGAIQENGVAIYKVSPYNVRRIFGEIEDTYKDHKGSYLPRSKWIEKYAYCGYCMQEVDPKDEHYLTTNGDAICGVCLKDPEIKETLVN